MRELLLALAVSIVTLAPPRQGFEPKAIEVASAAATCARIWPRSGAIALDGAPESGARFAQVRRGEILGLIQIVTEWRDYRAQTVPPGVYTLVYAVQPRLKDHAGTTEYRDFAILRGEEAREGHPFVMALVAPGNGDAQLRLRDLTFGLELDETGNLGF